MCLTVNVVHGQWYAHMGVNMTRLRVIERRGDTIRVTRDGHNAYSRVYHVTDAVTFFRLRLAIVRRLFHGHGDLTVYDDGWVYVV